MGRFLCCVGGRPPGSTRVRSSAASDVYKGQAFPRVALPTRPLAGHPDNLTERLHVAQAHVPAPSMQPQAPTAPAGTAAATQPQGPQPGQAAGSGQVPGHGAGALPTPGPQPFGYVPGQAAGSGGIFATQGTQRAHAPAALHATAKARSQRPRGGDTSALHYTPGPAPAGAGLNLRGRAYCPL